MTIALGTVAAVGFEEFPPREWLACFRQLGCTTVQVYRNQDAQISVQQMRDAVATGEMPCDSIHGVSGEEFDPSAPLEQARRFAVDTFKAEGELALKLGGYLVVVHCSTIRPQGISQTEHRRRIAQLRKSIVELGDFGSRLGVQYAFENLPGYHAIGSDVAELAQILNELKAPNTGMCFDTGHANMVCNPIEAMRRTEGQMIYIHLSDNSGKDDEHEMPTCGTIDTDAIAREIQRSGYSGTVMLEAFYSVDRLKQLIDEGLAKQLAGIIAIANGESEL